MDVPELLRDKLVDLLVPFDYETQSWELTWTIANDTLLLNDLS